MRIKATQLLKVEDFPEQKGWIGKLISPINDFLYQAIKILNNGLTFADNFLGKEFTFKFTYQSETITFPQQYFWPLAAKPLSLQVVSATEDGIPVVISLAWRFNTDGKIEITNVYRQRTVSTTGNTNSNTTLNSLASTAGLQTGMQVTGTDIPSGTFVWALSGTTATLSQAATATTSGVTVTFGPGLQLLGPNSRYEIRVRVTP